MKPFLSKAAVQLREQIDDSFPDRSRKSDGWIASAQHQMRSKVSDHNPLPSGEVCAIDITADLGASEGISAYLADQIRIAGKTDKRIKYVRPTPKLVKTMNDYAAAASSILVKAVE